MISPATQPILIVDDNKEVLRVVQNVVRYFGYECRGFDSGEELMAYLDSVSVPHLCIVDVTLPGMSGYEVLDQLELRGSGSRVILMSGDVRDGWSGGDTLVGYLQKPFGFENLEVLLKQWHAA